MEYALVLGGGGGKGAYEIGVWKALHEMGYDNRFTCVLGTSVGALNGALFCRNNLEIAEHVWLNDISRDKILPLPDVPSLLSGNTSALHTQDGVRQLLEQYLPEVMPDSPDFYRCTAKMEQSGKKHGLIETIFADEAYKAEYVKMNGLSREAAIPHLLASAAIPVVYPHVKGRRDGGMLAQHNLPYLEAARMGYEKILAVNLRDGTLTLKRKHIQEERRGTDYEGKPLPPGNSGVSETLILCPSISLGGFSGMLDFSTSGAKWRMERGYTDCMELYRKRIEAFFA